MKILTGMQRVLYNAIKTGSRSGQMVAVHKARHPLKTARLLEKKGYIIITIWDNEKYLARLTGKNPDAKQSRR